MPLCMTSLKSSLHVHVATNVKSEQTDTELKAVEAWAVYDYFFYPFEACAYVC